MKTLLPQPRKQFGTYVRGLGAVALLVLLGVAAAQPGKAADTGGTTTTNLSSAGRRTYLNPAEETTNALETLLAEVKTASMRVRESLPELKYANRGSLFYRTSVTMTKLLSAERLRFTLQIIDCPASFTPGTSFTLVYLRDPAGALVGWKSQWLRTGEGNLKTKILDANYDGVPDFCFICKPLRSPEQIISGYCVTNGQFVPVVAEHTVEFGVQFQETKLKDGLVIQPLDAGRQIWQASKLYEIPVRLLNRSTNEIDLRGRQLLLSDSYPWTIYPAVFANETLQPGQSMDATVTVRTSAPQPDQKFGFQLEPLPGAR